MKTLDQESIASFFALTKKVLKAHSVDAWLVYVKKEMRTWILRQLGLESAYISRPMFFLFFKDQDPTVLYSELDTPALCQLTQIPIRTQTYFSYVEQRGSLQKLLKNVKTLALDTIEEGALPSLSTIDAGFKSWIDRLGLNIISSSSFSDEILAKVTNEGLASHRVAAKALEEILERSFAWIQTHLDKQEIYEKQLRDLICQWMEEKELIISPPIVAFGPNSADPHYETVANGKKLERGDVVLIDLWSKLAKPRSIYADFTQVGYVPHGQDIPPQVLEVFDCVKTAQSKVIEHLQKELSSKKITGAEADQFARFYIEHKGYGSSFRHRTGHNVGADCHGLGVNLDSIEFPDPRMMLSEAIFTVEPGIYLPGKFGVRLECDLYIHPDYRVEVTGGLQEQLKILRPE